MADRRAIENIRRWQRDPVAFVREQFQVEPDHWQAEALRAFASRDEGKRRISLQACAGPGKTSVLAWCGWNFLLCYGEPGEHPKGAAVAITQDNLKDNLWPEFAKWQGRSPVLSRAFEWTKERIFAREHPETWFLSARSWSKSANIEEQGRTLSGLHSKYVLALIDESGEVPTSVLRAAEQALSNCKFGKIVQAGNPTSLEGMLYAAASMLRHLWHVIRITGDPDDPNRSARIDIEWAREQVALYGRENPWVMSYILGLFPPSSLNALLGVDEVEAAMRRHLREDQYDWAQKRLGIDVARFGDDRSVIFPRQGKAAFRPAVMRGARTTEIAARVAVAKDKWQSEIEFVDDTGGWGAGVIDQLIVGALSPMPVNFSGKATDPRYYNKRSELHFLAAEWVRAGGALPPIPELVREATAPLYWFHEGKLRVEEKAQIKARIGVSPDHWDALLTTFAIPDMPGASSAAIERARHAATEFDPHRDLDEASRARIEFDPYRSLEETL